jgi:hypothetical protein
MRKRLLYGPGDWLGTRWSARERRAMLAWALLLSIFPLTPLTFFWKDAVWMVWTLSIIAIWLSLISAVSAETPAEAEDDETEADL